MTLVATKLQLQIVPDQNENVEKESVSLGIKIFSQYCTMTASGGGPLVPYLSTTGGWWFSSHLLPFYFCWKLPLYSLNVWSDGPLKWSGHFGGGKKCLACAAIVWAQYVTASPFICEVRCYTSDVFLHNIHVIVITSVQGTYNYVPESNRVAGVYNVATLLQLLLLVHYFPW